MKTLTLIIATVLVMFLWFFIGYYYRGRKSPDYQAGYERGYVDGNKNSMSFIIDVDGKGHWGTKSDTVYLEKYCDPSVREVSFMFDRIKIAYDPFDSTYLMYYHSKDSTRYIDMRIPRDSVDTIRWHVYTTDDNNQ